MAFGKPKRDFLDDVVDEMGPGSKGDDYGASMDEADGEGGDDETAQEDRIMAAKQVGKALGISSADWSRVAEALGAFVKAC